MNIEEEKIIKLYTKGKSTIEISKQFNTSKYLYSNSSIFLNRKKKKFETFFKKMGVSI